MKLRLFFFFAFVLTVFSSCQNSSSIDETRKSIEIAESYSAIEAARIKAIKNPQIEYSPSESTEVVSYGSDTHEYNWFFKPGKNGLPPAGPDDNSYYKVNAGCAYIGDPTKKYIYLTFDQGYENGYTAQILDVLKQHKVKVAFFCVKPYIVANPALIKRMADEGHLVCNHSSHHPSMATITDQKKFKTELAEVEEAYKQITNKDMPKFFRPPMGKYSELSLKLTNDFGYKTIFWSLAYMDWLPDQQPTITEAKKKLLGRIHNGAIVLLHSVSKTNTEFLAQLITELKRQGYEFKTLEEL